MSLTESDNFIVGGFFVANFFLIALIASFGLKVVDTISCNEFKVT